MSRCKVGETEIVSYGGAELGYAFSIFDADGTALLTLTFASEEEAETAAEVMHHILEMTVDVSKERAIHRLECVRTQLDAK